MGPRNVARTCIALLTASALAIAAAGTGVAQDAPPPPTEDHVRAFAIDPPGQCGSVNLGNQKCAHFEDQLETYASLVNDDDVTEDELATYFHSMQFGPGAEIERTYSPADGMTVYRDTMGVPHIYADSLDNASYALGYVSAEDRMFEMDVFRHAARGTLTELLGSGEDDAFLEMDIATRREGYTEEEIQKMFDDLDDNHGDMGKVVQGGLQAYSDGVNQFIEEMRMDARKQVLEYPATGNPYPAFPEEWTPADTLFLVVLQLRVFGETAGDELQNAGLYAHLVKRLGRKLGRKVYADLSFQNDSGSPTSIARKDLNSKTQRLGRVRWRSIAVPDNAEDVARNTLVAERQRDEFLASLGFRSPASNALLVSRDESATGNPLHVGAPQVGYAVPGFFMEIDVHAPGVDFRGPAVPGASALIPLGRGRDYAWSLTTGFSDAVDTRAELLCQPGGGEPTLESTGFRFKGECREMEAREETFTVKPAPTSPEPPREETRTFHRTVHGPVFQRAMVNGKPVAFVKERFFWKKEIDSIPQFARWNISVQDIDDFAAAARDFTMSFNAFYADASNIGYFHVGYYPKRTKGVHPSLPIWGTGKWEWKGRRPYRLQPHVLDPDTGWVANWNNKPTEGWSNYDSAKWGPIQRVELLQDKMEKLLAGSGKATLSDLVDVIGESATQDTRGVYLGPSMLRMGGRNREASDRYGQALDAVRAWVRAGAHRKNADNDDNMDDGVALAIFDRWYDKLVHSVFDDELGEDGYTLTQAPVTDYDPTQGSSFWFDFSSYLDNVFGKNTRKGLALDYCDNRGTKRKKETCRSLVIDALNKALEELTQEQGQDMAAWTTPREDIVFQEFGAASVDPIPWQNRGTHNHVVEILRDAGRVVVPSPQPTGGATPTPSGT